ncbi:MAG: CRISPR-associated RAMP protein [Oscillospiraceae bacterium]|jgi:CRISPR-associated RAMP protein (TIGR02581 family)|nr:CRISPR-associated RAMP protein [Oscillospiraceae bacterium]
MFDQFYNRLSLTTELVAVTALHVGAGQDAFQPTAVQGAVMKDVRGQPYLPGSSLKGVLRSFLESIGLNQHGGKPCYMGNACSEPYRTRAERLDWLEKWQTEELKKGKKISQEEAQEVLAKEIVRNACMACRLFGSSVLAGKVKISDAIPATEELITTDIRTGNAIDRDTHTVEGGMLFDTETIPAGTVFTVKWLADNLIKEETEVFAQLLQVFADGDLTIGGRSRSGLGRACLRPVSATVWTRPKDGGFPIRNEKNFLKVEDLKEWFNEGAYAPEIKPAESKGGVADAGEAGQ